ncbi:MAG: DinB family protein [Rhodothermales bacterium]
MFNTELLSDLYRHMEWADATMWKALQATPAVLEDESLKERLFHIHFTQYSFLTVWRGDEFKFMKSDAFESLDDIYTWMRGNYATLHKYIATLEDEKLSEPMEMPWAKYFGRQLGREVKTTTLGETLMQVCSHSVHHRGQVNMQIRAHGGEPPLIDYIVWLWSDRPGAEWS